MADTDTAAPRQLRQADGSPSRAVRIQRARPQPGLHAAKRSGKALETVGNNSVMDIPYVVKLREDTNLYNAKVGIWLFLASEVMLFGALFSSYILLGVVANSWPHGLLNLPFVTF